MARTDKKLEEALKFKKYPAQDKKYNEAIVFSHFFDGSPSLIKRHIDYVNGLGFDAYAYQVSFHLKKRKWKDFLPKQSRLGLKNFWTKDLEKIVNKIQGDKILFAFSNPASSAIEVAAKRFRNNKKDIKAIICDSGPFYDLVNSSKNLIKDYFKVQSPLLHYPSSVGMSVLLAPLHETYLYRDLKTLPKNFPILSIRGWQDSLVPVRSIEKVFEPHEHIDLQVLNLPDAGHLNGLKDFSEDYKPVVERFLKLHASKVD